jgi:choline-sulfatase
MGALLFGAVALLEAAVLYAKRPEPWSLDLVGRFASGPVLYALVGVAAGLLAGLVAVPFLAGRPRTWSLAARRSAVWSLLLPAILALYWVYDANRLYPGGSRDRTALLLDGLTVLLAALLAWALWRRSVVRGLGRRGRIGWTVVILGTLWLPLYAASSAPALEHTRIATPPIGVPPAKGPNVVFLMLDTVRADALSCYGGAEFPTPAIDRIAEDGVLFEQAVTPEPLTRPAVSSMFTGLYPRTHGVDTNTKALGPEFTTVAEAMRAAGYRTAAFTAASVLSAYYGTAQGFDYYSEPSEPWWYPRSDTALRSLYLSLTSLGHWWVEIPADEVTRRAIRWLGRNGDRPFFAFVHYFDAHAPYRPPRVYDFAAKEGLAHIPAPYEDENERFSPDFVMPEHYLRREWLRYLGEIAFVDENVGRLLDYLDASGLSGNTIVVLVADHGESFAHHAYFSHGTRLYDEQVRVPFLVRGPGIAGPRRIAGQVRLIDVCPTILTLAGVPLPGPVQGADLSPRITGSPEGSDLVAFCQTDLEDKRPLSGRASHGVRLPPWKYIETPDMGVVELYRLDADSDESDNVAAGEPRVDAALAGALADWMATTTETEVAPSQLAPEAREALRALGYLQ